MYWKSVNLDFAKNYVKEQVLRQVLGYLEKDPEVNLPRIFKLVKLLAIKEEHKKYVEQAALAYRQNPAVRTFVNRLFITTHPNVKHRLIYNWFINAMIFGIPKQAQMSQKHGVHIPNFFLLDPTNGPVAGSLDQKAEHWGVVADGIREERQNRYLAQSGCR